ncbi:MAG: hypothetical protein LJE65_02295 [Desulfobacteraceae bacterium]|jgi:hypothetical protein|nr:hypothetical protein [Desulfobacteraceae bacterium]
MLGTIGRTGSGLLVAMLLLTATVQSVGADDVTTAIEEALKAYQDGDHSTAVESLNYASQLIQQKKGEALKDYFPEPLKGWQAQEATSETIGAAMMGGGLTASRTYSRDDRSVTVQFVTDSPMLQPFMMMLANPMAAASNGGKLETIGGQKALVQYDASKKRGDIRIVVANRVLVTLEGNAVSAEDLKAYAQAVDYDRLSKMP